MADKASSARNPFGFSLMGLKASAPYVAGMAIADVGINAAWDERLGRNREDRDQTAVDGD